MSKLAELAKGRVKFEEFTQIDRNNLLDLFVNNERTLLKIYEILFSQPNFKQSQILANPSDSIYLNEGSQKNFMFLDSSMFTTNQTGGDTSMDHTAQHSPSPYDAQTSFALDDLNQDSQMVTERGEQSVIKNRNGDGKHGSGQLILNTINNQATPLPNILPAITQGVQSDVRLIKNNNPNQPSISFSP